MNYRPLGKTGLEVSEVGLGALELGAAYGIGEECGQIPSDEEAAELLQAAVEAGINLFDTAGIYGLSEHRIGRFLLTTRQRVIVTTKLNVGERNGKKLDTMCCIVFEIEGGQVKSGTEHFFDLANWDQFWS